MKVSVNLKEFYTFTSGTQQYVIPNVPYTTVTVSQEACEASQVLKILFPKTSFNQVKAGEFVDAIEEFTQKAVKLQVENLADGYQVMLTPEQEEMILQKQHVLAGEVAAADLMVGATS